MVDLTKTVRIDTRRTSFGTEILDLSGRRGDLETKLLDLGEASELQAQLRRLCADKSQRGAPSPDLPVPLSDLPVRSPAPPVALPESPVALGHPPVVPRENSPSHELERTIYDGGALRDFARTLAEGPDLPAVPTAPSVRHRELRSRQLLRVLLPLVLAVSALGTGMALIRQRASTHAPPAAAPSSTAVTVARPLPSAQRTPLPQPTSPPAPSTSPALSRDPILERAALRAAFDGNQREAIADYERLGERPGGEPFKLAARLLRDDHVRKP
jgi:hypothetical protein